LFCEQRGKTKLTTFFYIQIVGLKNSPNHLYIFCDIFKILGHCSQNKHLCPIELQLDNYKIQLSYHSSVFESEISNFLETTWKNKDKNMLFSAYPVPIHHFVIIRDTVGPADIHEAQTECLEKKRERERGGWNFSQSTNMSPNFNYSNWWYLQCNPKKLSIKTVSGQHGGCNVSFPFLPVAFRIFWLWGRRFIAVS